MSLDCARLFDQSASCGPGSSVASGSALERLAAQRAVLRASRSQPIEIGSFRLGFGSLSSALARARLSRSHIGLLLKKHLLSSSLIYCLCFVACRSLVSMLQWNLTHTSTEILAREHGNGACNSDALHLWYNLPSIQLTHL